MEKKEHRFQPAHAEFVLPQDMDSPVWRYMSMRKFGSFLERKALYLCRANRLEQFEGSYSRQQIVGMNEYLRKIGHPELVETERERRRRDKLRTYINCWCIGTYDLDLMWKGYVGNGIPGVAIKSTPRRLHSICEKEGAPIGITKVKYLDHARGQHINYFGTPGNFVYKDHHFSLDSELRIIYWPNMAEPTPDHHWLQINLNELVAQIVLSPRSTETELGCIIQSLHKAGLTDVPVECSRDDRDFID